MADGDLTILENAQSWLAIASPTDAQNNTLERLISAASSRMQAYIGYQIAEDEYQRCFDGVGGSKIMLPDRPVISVSSVLVNGVAIPAAAMPQPGFVFDATSVGLVSYRFERGLQNVVVTYTAGFPSTPPDLEQACLEWVSGAYNAQLRDPALTEVSAGDQKEKYGGTDTMLAGRIIPMPASTLSALMPYRRVSSW